MTTIDPALVARLREQDIARKQQAAADRKAAPTKTKIGPGQRWSPVFQDVTSVEPWRPQSWRTAS